MQVLDLVPGVRVHPARGLRRPRPALVAESSVDLDRAARATNLVGRCLPRDGEAADVQTSVLLDRRLARAGHVHPHVLAEEAEQDRDVSVGHAVDHRELDLIADDLPLVPVHGGVGVADRFVVAVHPDVVVEVHEDLPALVRLLQHLPIEGQGELVADPDRLGRHIPADQPEMLVEHGVYRILDVRHLVGGDQVLLDPTPLVLCQRGNRLLQLLAGTDGHDGEQNERELRGDSGHREVLGERGSTAECAGRTVDVL